MKLEGKVYGCCVCSSRVKYLGVVVECRLIEYVGTVGVGG